jgi:DNA-directed RNA polymerase subunit RPC12/RpoP
MCRYGGEYGPYKQHYACFECRKSFKQPLDAHRPPEGERSGDVTCPQCGGPMHSMGLDFQAPPRRNTRQWEKVRILFAHGYAYHSCGCGGPGDRPRTLGEVPAFLARRRPRSEGEALLWRISAREQGGARWKREASRSENHGLGQNHWPRRSVLQTVRAR